MFDVLDRYGEFTDLKMLKEFSARPLRKSLRVNLLKSSVEKFKEWAKRKGWQIEQVSWCKEGFFVERFPVGTPHPNPLPQGERGNSMEALGKDLLHIVGHTYMQEAASMLPVALLDPKPGDAVLDMCAAPGSKTTQIAARMGGGGVIVANEVQEKRLWTLKAGLHRSGVPNVLVTKKVGQWFGRHMTERFDKVLCDAPCTAQGTVRKDSDALNFCGPENIGKMARLQKELLESAVHAAKVGGTIVYSTCTLTPEENEMVVLQTLNKFSDQLEVVDPLVRLAISDQRSVFERTVNDSLQVQEWISSAYRLPLTAYPCMRLWPHAYDTEGFFAAVLRKKSPTRDKEFMEWIDLKEEPLPRVRSEEMRLTLRSHYGMDVLKEGECLWQSGRDQLVLTTDETVRFRLPVADYALGLPFGKRLSDNRVMLGHEMATLRGHEATKNFHELDEASLEEILRGKDIICSSDLHGHVILRFGDVAIGYGLAKEGKIKNNLPRWIVGLRN